MPNYFYRTEWRDDYYGRPPYGNTGRFEVCLELEPFGPARVVARVDSEDTARDLMRAFNSLNKD